jgi:hypothetical protein
MTGKPGALSEKPTELPARFDRLFPWLELDRRCSTVREFSGDLVDLWQDLGGVETLSAQKRWLCERVVFMRRQMLAYETAIVQGTTPLMTAGEYSNLANVTQGHLKTLGIERRMRSVRSLHDVMKGLA